MSKGIGRYITLTVAVFVLSTAPAWAVSVGLELLLLVDVSGSVDAGEYALQKGGYVAAFQSTDIHDRIESITGGIAVAYAEWSSAGDQDLLVGWTHLTDAADSDAFAAAIAATSRASSGLTAPGNAIKFGRNLFTSNIYDGARLVMDISGDGSENDGINTFGQATAAHAQGITINGLAILGDELNLDTWYLNNITTPGGGTLYTATFGNFETAVAQKIGREITVPEPTTLLLLGGGILGLTLRRFRR